MSRYRLALCLLAAALLVWSLPARAAGVDCGEKQTFSSGLGGWRSWWSGSAPVVDASAGRTDAHAMRLQGRPGTAAREILPTECPFGIAYVSYYARVEAGMARISTKLVDQVTGATLYDSVDTAPVTVGTGWTRISIPVAIKNPTLIGIAVDPVAPATTVTAFVDDVVVANDACVHQSFADDTGGFALGASGNPPERVAAGRTDAGSLRLSGPSYGTAERTISPGECPQALTRIAYYARAEAGSALVRTKLVDQVTGTTLWDTNTGPVAVSSTGWTRIVVDAPVTNATLLGITVEAQGGGSVSVLVDDVMLNPGSPSPPRAQPDNVPVPTRPGWELTWSDDFSSGVLDGTKWVAITTGPTHASSTEGFGETWGQECYDAAQVVVADGSLQLTAKRQDSHCLGTSKPWLSGLVVSRGRFSQAYGRFEARIKMPVARGSWPAFWMLPQTRKAHGSCGMGWPCSGEIDILEYVGNLNPATNATEPGAVFGTLHWGNAQRDDVQDSGQFNVAPSVDRWTVYAVEWDETGISFFVDDNFVKRVAFPLPGGAGVYTGAQPFDVPFYFILNQSVGGRWPGAPDAADYPSTVKIDYVAAYRRAAGP